MRFKELQLTFQTPGGLDGMLTIELDAADRPSEIIKMLDAKLTEAGCKPKPQPRAGGFVKREKPPIPENCPACQKKIIEKSGTDKNSGRAWKLYKCPANEEHYKQFR